MTQSPVRSPDTDHDGVPYSDYVHTLTLVDHSPASSVALPVHVAQRALINDDKYDPGTVPTVRINLNESWSIVGSGKDATMVSMLVHPDDVTLGRRDADGNDHPFMIGDRRVLVPKGCAWETVHAYEPQYPDGPRKPIWSWVRVYIFVREAHLTTGGLA